VYPANHLHPEFGLLCPSRTLRRAARLVLAAPVILLVGWLAQGAGNNPERIEPAAVEAPFVAVATRAEVPAMEPAIGQGARTSDAGQTERQRPHIPDEAATLTTRPGRIVPVPMASTALAEPAYAEHTAAPTPAVATPPRSSTAKPKKVKKASSRAAPREARRDRSHEARREARRDRSYEARRDRSHYVDGRFGWGGYGRGWGYSW
jgi:hypothetical protein